MSIHQLSFDFTRPIERSQKRHQPNWKVRVIARRHRIPIAQAEVYMAAMPGLGDHYG